MFIGCGKEKRRTKSSSLLLYTGQYFKTCLALARRLVSDDQIYVLSAKHGVLSCHDSVEPYDVTLRDFSAAQLKEWRSRVLPFVTARIKEGCKPVYICGRIYNDGLPGVRVLPDGLGIGEQLQYMKRLLAQGQGFDV